MANVENLLEIAGAYKSSSFFSGKTYEMSSRKVHNASTRRYSVGDKSISLNIHCNLEAFTHINSETRAGRTRHYYRSLSDTRVILIVE